MKPTNSYNLLGEKWIPVLFNNGKFERVGIKQALTEAHQIRQIAASNPMDRVAIIRFLLALLYWCKGNPPDNEKAMSADSFPKDWFQKLDDNKECFNLLGEGKRFYQYKIPGDKQATINYLIHEIPTGINFWHFRHATEELNGLCPACCALGLLRLPIFSTSGGRGKSPGINAKPPIYIIPIGQLLASTIRLSWRQVSNLGEPAWKNPALQLPNRGEVPLLTGLTWLPRRVWLDNPEETEDICISCGRKEYLIKHCIFAGIGTTKSGEDSPGRIWKDPQVIYEQTNKGDIVSLHAKDALGADDAAAGQWAEILARVVGKNEPGKLWVVGFSTVQNDKYLEATEWLIPLSNLPEQPQKLIQKIEQWIKETKIAKKIPHKEFSSVIASVRPHTERRVSVNLGRLLSGGDEAWEEAAREYRPMMEALAQSLSPGFTVTAVQRRKGIANTLPDMGTKTEPEKKSRQKKGENQ